MAASGHGSAVSLPQNVDRAIEDVTIDDMAASGHGSAVSLPQNVDRAIKYNHRPIHCRETARRRVLISGNG
jgi:hypothetical protein